MKLKTPSGGYIIGTKEVVPGTALASHFKADGAPIYEGETKIWWDDQKTVWGLASRIYVDDDGEEYTLDQLEVVPDDYVEEEEEEE